MFQSQEGKVPKQWENPEAVSENKEHKLSVEVFQS